MGQGENIGEQDLGLTTPTSKKTKPLKEVRDNFEREYIIQLLVCNRWNITHTARALGISQKGVRYLIKKHKIVKQKTNE
jgi:DNA-binding NtrC family response regulator